jgi:hypothetical protein
LPAEGFPIESQWHIVRPRGKRHSPVADAFEQHLEEASTELRERVAELARPSRA